MVKTESLILLFILDLIATFAIYIIANLSLNFQLGYAGIPNFGLVFAFTGGAYAVGWLPVRLCMGLFHINSDLGVDIIKNNAIIMSQINFHLQTQPLIGLAVLGITLIVAAMIGAVLGFISAYPAIRLRTDYLAITLLALGDVLYIFGINYEPLVGGVLGVQVPDVWAWLGDKRYSMVSLILMLFALAVLVYVSFIGNSPLGRTLRAIRDDEVAASSLGKNVVKLRIEALVIGSMICSIGGALYAFYTCGVCPTAYGRMDWTFLPWLMVVIGGIGNNLGATVGTITFISLRKLIIFYKELFAFLPFDVVWMEYLILGTALILVLLFRPAGLIKEKSSKTLPESKLKTIISKVLGGK